MLASGPSIANDSGGSRLACGVLVFAIMDFPRRRAAGLLVIALMTLPCGALADRVVVGSIRGDDGDAIRAQVEATLRERVEVVPWSDFRAAYRGLDAEAIKTACRAIGARAIVLGDVEGRRRLHLMALSCDTGEISAQSQVDLRRGLPRHDSLNAAVAAMFFEQGSESLLAWATGSGQARPAPVAGPSPAQEAAPVPAEEDTSSAGEQTAVASLLATSSSGPIRQHLAAHATDDEPTGAAVEAELAPVAPLPSFLELAVGATFATRSLDVQDRAGNEVAYDGGGYTELGGSATVFPIAVVSRARWARAIGFTGSFSKGVGVRSSAGSGLNVDTLDGGLGLVGRLAFEGSLPIELRPSVGYGFRGFAIDWNPDIATFNYRFLRVGLDVRAALFRRASYAEGTLGALTLGASGGYRFVTDLGEAATSYGADASASGWDVGAFFSVLLGKSMEITAGGEIARFSSTFAGAGSLDRLADSSSDVFPRAFLRAGIALR